MSVASVWHRCTSYHENCAFDHSVLSLTFLFISLINIHLFVQESLPKQLNIWCWGVTQLFEPISCYAPVGVSFWQLAFTLPLIAARGKRSHVIRSKRTCALLTRGARVMAARPSYNSLRCRGRNQWEVRKVIAQIIFSHKNMTLTIDLVTLTLGQLQRLISINKICKYHQDQCIHSWFIDKKQMMHTSVVTSRRPRDNTINLVKRFESRHNWPSQKSFIKIHPYVHEL